MSIETELLKLRTAYNAKVTAVRADGNLSEEGRAQALKDLANARQKEIDRMVRSLRGQAQSASERAERLRKNKIELARKESESLDYVRLTYEAAAVRSALATIGDVPQRAAAMFEDVKASGDTYKIKAWLDTLPSQIPTNSPNAQTWRGLVETMGEAKTLFLSSDMAKLSTDAELCASEIETIKSDTDLIVHELASSEGGGYAGVIQAVRKHRQEISALVFEDAGGSS